MSCVLQNNAYGKSRVRLTKVIRQPQRHELKELSVDIQLEGDFAPSYTAGDNSKVVATDSMKNTVYVLAAEHPLNDIEGFAVHLAQHFTQKYAQVKSATVHIQEDLWNRIVSNGSEHKHSFVSAGDEKRVTTVTSAQGALEIESGIENLLVLKTTDSEFWGFVRDEYTTLPEVRDRIFATSVAAYWLYGQQQPDFNEIYARVRQLILDVFAKHHSLAVQQTLHEMGKEALAACPHISEISITMPNQHRIPFDLTRFNMENKNEIFVPTDEPYGLISAQIVREAKQMSSIGADKAQAKIR